MSEDNVQNFMMEQMRAIRASVERLETRLDQVETKLSGDIRSLRTAIGGQGVMLNGIAGYVGELTERIDVLEGKGDDD